MVLVDKSPFLGFVGGKWRGRGRRLCVSLPCDNFQDLLRSWVIISLLWWSSEDGPQWYHKSWVLPTRTRLFSGRRLELCMGDIILLSSFYHPILHPFIILLSSFYHPILHVVLGFPSSRNTPILPHWSFGLLVINSLGHRVGDISNSKVGVQKTLGSAPPLISPKRFDPMAGTGAQKLRSLGQVIPKSPDFSKQNFMSCFESRDPCNESEVLCRQCVSKSTFICGNWSL